MAKNLCFIIMLLTFLLIVESGHAQESPSPEPESLADSPSSSPELDSPLSPASSPEPESLPDSPSPPPPPPQPESPSAPSPSPGPAPVPAPSDEDSDDDSQPETEYFPSPAPSPVGKPDDIKASDNTPEDGEELEDARGEGGGISGLKKAGIAIGAILGVGTIVIGALAYKKRRDNMTRARYTYFNQGEFL